MQSSFSKRLLSSLALVSFASADYYIDDQNLTSLIYQENPGSVGWVNVQGGGISIIFDNGKNMTVDASQCFNYTYANTCSLCRGLRSLLGSGITIYVLQAGPWGVNASLTIDEGAPNYNALPAPSGPDYYAPNVTLLSVQGITTGNHTATMAVQNWDNVSGTMLFDYAVINQTIVATTTSSVASSTAVSTVTSKPTPSPSKSTTNVGAMVGVALGAMAGLIALLLVFFYLCRRRREPQRLSMDLDADIRRRPDVTAHPTTEKRMTGTVGTHVPFRSESSGLSVTSPEQTGSHKIPAGPSEITCPRIQQRHSTLTDDQADFVNNLYRNNVPAPAIARVIERMMAGERRPSVDRFDSLPPPSYYDA
ncbi:hypothetical protein L210DRAFT_3532158 [Boletus edulis BED1]|uniref:Transmembrane protein n=1 Tax=Boletus edulis BED1 TaxID=1328754 RepID=A0AAD4GI23_BOLED|nr:hypothetical protein L210DRAFT_3532158 [Boletus edulis BED1]